MNDGQLTILSGTWENGDIYFVFVLDLASTVFKP